MRLPAVAQTLVFWRRPLWYLERSRRRYGSRFTLNAASHPPLVFTCSPADIKAIFTAPADVLQPGAGIEPIVPIVGEQSFMRMEESAHLQGRRAILPIVHAPHGELMRTVIERHVASWPTGVPFALHPRLRALTLEIILRTVLGIPAETPDERLNGLAEKLFAMLAVTASPLLSAPLLRHGPGQRLWKRFLRERDEADQLIFALIEHHRRAGDGLSNPLALLLAERNADGSPMSDRQVRDNLVSLILAGHETTAAELGWAFQLLAHHPSVLNTLTAELDNGGDAYLTATIQEVLRHRPAVLFAPPRAVRRPIQIGNTTFHPPAQLLACIYLVHHDPAIHPEPYAFRPERFLQTPPAGYTWLPWGGGPRRCPGARIAVYEMQHVLRATLSTRLVRATSRKIERPRWRSVIVTPWAGCRIELHPRHPSRPASPVGSPKPRNHAMTATQTSRTKSIHSQPHSPLHSRDQKK